tara:strand:- start:1330 stop:1782 length:453 start_codon:yes stop_codon:yes gene_type:complete
MNILNTHEHRLIFRIDIDAPKAYMDRWKGLKLKCESGDNESILDQIKGHCKLQQNKEKPYLNRVEGGLGGDNNTLNKQIRFRYYKLWSELPKYIDNDIILDKVTNGREELWTYEELDDIIYGFIKTSNKIVEAECISGSIEIKNINGYSY